MIKNILLLLVLLSAFLISKADTIPTILFGTNTEYGGQIIKLYKYANYITKTKELLACDTVSTVGEFELSYIQNETLLITLPLGIYESVLFTEPGKKYHVVLPPDQPKTKGDVLNPFFQPVQVYLGINNADSLELNFMIAEFNELYHNYIDSNYHHIFQNPKSSSVDNVIQKISARYTDNKNQFFKDYREYKYAWLKYVSYMRDYRYVIREYYHNKPFLYQNPAYMDLFSQLFTNYLSFYATTKEGRRIYSDIAFAKSPTYVKQTFANNMVLINDTLQELVLLKGLHDAFYSKDFPTANLLMTLDSVVMSSKIQVHKSIAQSVREKVLQARSGYEAPQFELRDMNGVFRHSKEFLANYVYLNFISIESFTCQQDLELLKGLYEKHKSDFMMVSICIDDDFSKTVELFKEKGYDWMLLSYRTQKSVVEDYNVRSYPSYYLLNPEGLLSLSPALSPGENFELQFFRLIQAQKRKQRY
ncbi:MAG: thioredoxin-like domain-containing protein [Salinivirgaceae bacterium]|jgi:hypothetical protein|nr:thioredoxin-like domain-containing protein [Salinivirgaceae bacterium]